MPCPTCHQKASSLSRSVFSLQGVSVITSAMGYLVCQNCGTLLRVKTYGKRFWFFYIPGIVGLLIFVLLFRRIVTVPGIVLGIAWGTLIVAIAVAFTVGVWKNAELEQVGSKKKEG
jgi:hypothetical protein